jgi:ribosome-binding factor A
MNNKQLPHIKKSQKEALLMKELSQLFLQISIDDSRLAGVSITHVELSPNRSVCTLYFYIPGGLEAFDPIRSVLILYKPSMRKALAQRVPSRHVPDIFFKYDEKFEKQMKLENLFNSLDTNENE